MTKLPARSGSRSSISIRSLRAALAALCLLAISFAASPLWAEQRVRVGLYENSPKVAYAGSGKAEGIFVDLIEAIAAKEGWTIDYVPGTWSEGLARLAAGQIDLMPDVALTTERRQIYAFHDEPVLSSWNQVYARHGSGIRSLLDLEGKSVAVLEDSVQEAFFRQMVAGFGINVQLRPLPDFAAAFAAVANGEADAVVTNRFYGARHAAAAGLEDTAIIFSPSRLHFAAPISAERSLLAAIDRHLVAFKADSTSVYYRSLRRWTSDELRPAVPRWLASLALAAAALLLGGGIWTFLLKRQVAAKTREIRLRSDEVLVLNRTLRAATSRLELHRVLEEAMRGALSLTGLDGGVICVRDPGQGELRVAFETQADAGARQAPEAGFTNEHVFPAVEEIARAARRALLERAASGVRLPFGNAGGADARWNAFFPLQVRDRQIGLLCLYSRRSEAPAQHALDLVQEICVPVSLAIENARLYEQTRQDAKALEQRVMLRTRELAELSTFLQAMIDRIPNVIFYKGPDNRFLGCNSAYETAFGVGRDFILGKRVLDLEYLPAAYRSVFHAESEQVIAEGATITKEIAFPFADGQQHHTLYSVTGFRKPDGSPGGMVGVIVDITPLKDAESALLNAKQAAEAADRIKSAFLATMSHELRTPLNAIIGFTGLVLQELPGPLNVEQKKQLGMVRDSSRHLLALINDVLDLSKIEAGELKVAAAPFDLAASIAKVSGIVAPLAGKKGLTLRIEGAERVGGLVGDARRVEQILLNLLGNAIKFTEAGSVTLACERIGGFVAKDGAAPCAAVRLRVTDTGVGIKPEDMALVFMPFRQVDAALSRNHEGSGLGLAICRRLVALMGGTIEAESRWGEGSVFTVTLPLHPPADRRTS